MQDHQLFTMYKCERALKICSHIWNNWQEQKIKSNGCANNEQRQGSFKTGRKTNWILSEKGARYLFRLFYRNISILSICSLFSTIIDRFRYWKRNPKCEREAKWTKNGSATVQKGQQCIKENRKRTFWPESTTRISQKHCFNMQFGNRKRHATTWNVEKFTTNRRGNGMDLIPKFSRKNHIISKAILCQKFGPTFLSNQMLSQ